MNEQQRATLLQQFRTVVPGDIWMKESKTVPGTWNAHFAAVPTDPTIIDPIEFMKQITLVEGEFNDRIQSVIKVLSVADYNNNTVTRKKLSIQEYHILPGLSI